MYHGLASTGAHKIQTTSFIEHKNVLNNVKFYWSTTVKNLHGKIQFII